MENEQDLKVNPYEIIGMKEAQIIVMQRLIENYKARIEELEKELEGKQ